MSEFTSFASRNIHLVKLAPSRLERHTEAFFLANSVPGTKLAVRMNGEIAHVHGYGDFSVHVTLAPSDCKIPSFFPSPNLDLAVHGALRSILFAPVFE